MTAKFAFAQDLIRQAGQTVRQLMDQPYQVTAKSRFDDLVTSVDKAIQDQMVAAIQAAYPSDHILAEENDLRAPIDQGKVWVIDPIDGTVNFIVQGEAFTILLAYFEEGQGQFGLIYDVLADKLVVGGPDFPATVNGKALPEFADKPLNETLLGVNAAMFSHNVLGLQDLAQKTLGVRVYGGSGYSMVKVFEHGLLAYFSYLYPWDYAAGAVIGKALGYELLTLSGQEPDWTSRQMVMLIPSAKKAEILANLSSNEEKNLQQD